MLTKNLNKVFDYTLKGKTYIPKRIEFRLIYNKNIKKSDWNNSNFKVYRQELKLKHYFGQSMRCAYCRVQLRADAYWEDLDHIVSQNDKGSWIFYPKNLIVTCEPCNRLKNANLTLANPKADRFPLFSNGFNIFNPHFDRWSDHFEIINGIFLKGKQNTKGPATYEHCHLYRSDVIIYYVDQQRIWNVLTMRRLTHKLKDSIKGSIEEIHILKAINHLIQRKKYNL